MATRAIIRFATREPGVSFSEHPEKYNAQFYRHFNGNVEYLGLEIVNSLLNSQTIDELEIDDLATLHDDADYIYYIWQHYDKSTWMSIFKVGNEVMCDQPDCCKKLVQKVDKCIFVGEPITLQDKINDLRDFETLEDKLQTKYER